MFTTTSFGISLNLLCNNEFSLKSYYSIGVLRMEITYIGFICLNKTTLISWITPTYTR